MRRRLRQPITGNPQLRLRITALHRLRLLGLHPLLRRLAIRLPRAILRRSSNRRTIRPDELFGSRESPSRSEMPVCRAFLFLGR